MNNMIQYNQLLLPEAPIFSKFLEQTFEGNVSVIEVKGVRQGFISRRNRFLTSLLGGGIHSRLDEDKFNELQKHLPGNRFIGPFYQCLKTTINFIPQGEQLERYVGEFKVYPEFRDKKTGHVPMTYGGFRPGVGHPNRIGVDYMDLIFGNYSSLVKLRDNFDVPWAKEVRGSFGKRKEWKRYDGHIEIPFL